MSKCADSKTLLKKKARKGHWPGIHLRVEVWGKMTGEGGKIKYLALALGLFTDVSMEDNGHCQGRGM